MHDESKEEKKFITSPADIDTYRETKLKDAELSEQDREKFETLCIQYDDVFSKDSMDLGRSPLLTMEISIYRHWRSSSYNTKAIQFGLEACRMGPRGDRKVGASRGHNKKYVTMGKSYCNSA